MAGRRTPKRATYVSGQSDRRVRKTTAHLQDALHALISEKPYEEIAVKEILDRADVGRSTFYEHYDGKDELLQTSIGEMLAASPVAAASSERAWYERALTFSAPILQYHERHRSARREIAESEMNVLHERLHAAVVDAVSEALPAAFLERRTARSAPAVPPELLVQTIAATFMLTFRWWLRQSPPCPASEAYALFRSLIVPLLDRL